MDMLMLGETLCSDDEGTATYQGFWMSAGGNDGVAAVEVFLVNSADHWTVAFETKTSDATDAGAGTIGSTLVSSATPGIFRFDVVGAKDLVRYVVSVDGGSGSGFIHFQLCQPLWAPN